MTDEQQPELRWAPIEPKPKNRGGVWLIIGLVAAVLLVVAVLLFFLVPRGAGPVAEPTPSPGTSETESPIDPTASPAPADEATPSPSPTALSPASQLIDDQLEAALSDLDSIEAAPTELGLSIVSELQDNAQRLSDSLAGAGLSGYEQVSAYDAALVSLRSSIEGGADLSTDLEAARVAVHDLRAVLRA